MTKREIYETVVHLTEELSKIEIPQMITEALAEGDSDTIDLIFDAFPIYYPFLYEQIVEFGESFNELVGDSVADNKKFAEVLDDCGYVMYNLAGTDIISQIAEATASGDDSEVLKLIKDFKENNASFVKTLLDFQCEYKAFRDDNRTGREGQIFGSKPDEENGVFSFDVKRIDAMSFYVLTILANTGIAYFFYDYEDEGSASEVFEGAIKKATNTYFAEFVIGYVANDWVGDNEDYQSMGELLTDAYIDMFE